MGAGEEGWYNQYHKLDTSHSTVRVSIFIVGMVSGVGIGWVVRGLHCRLCLYIGRAQEGSACIRYSGSDVFVCLSLLDMASRATAIYP